MLGCMRGCMCGCGCVWVVRVGVVHEWCVFLSSVSVSVYAIAA